MKNLSPKEAITILEGMRIDIPLPKAAVTQMKRNLALDMAINALNCSEIPNNSDTISRQQAIDALDKRFDNVPMEQTAEILGLRKDLRELPSVQPTLYGYNIEHLELIARVLRKEDLPPERVAEALTDIGRIVAIVRDEFEEALRKAVEQCTI